MCSQTAWERSGIQNQGPRPEHSSLSSLASRTFSSVWKWEKVCDSFEPGCLSPPSSPCSLTPQLWSQASSAGTPAAVSERQCGPEGGTRALEPTGLRSRPTLPLTICETTDESSGSSLVKWEDSNVLPCSVGL